MLFTLQAIASSQTRPLPIDTLSTDPARASTVEFMADGGYQHYVASDADIRQMMRQAIDASLARSSIRPDRIQAILLSTESFWDSGLGETSHRAIPPSERLREMLCEEIAHAGLVNAMPFGNWMSACSNFGSTLALGSALLESGRYRRVMAVFADRTPATESRFVRDGSALYSDVAAACILAPDAFGYRIRHIVSHSGLAMLRLPEGMNARERNQHFRTQMSEFKLKITVSTGREIADYPLLVTDNLHPMFTDLMCRQLGIDPGVLVTPTRGTLGHAYAADCLLALGELETSGRLKPGEVVGVLNFGTSTFSFLELELVSS
ncbi:hypothetical protein [Lysobacter hankyongensis]|uniref:Beta-ketoacyl-[acyl-carrier-protein] synthase III N-terminal domain-containing protein n=1 Tax=Lysobacter hankyongensis TaxID=1176535 RepID=A0ABP9AJP4_9GAMM